SFGIKPALPRHDPKAERRGVSALFQESQPENRQAEKSGYVSDTESSRKARTRGAVFQTSALSAGRVCYRPLARNRPSAKRPSPATAAPTDGRCISNHIPGLKFFARSVKTPCAPQSPGTDSKRLSGRPGGTGALVCCDSNPVRAR